MLYAILIVINILAMALNIWVGESHNLFIGGVNLGVAIMIATFSIANREWC